LYAFGSGYIVKLRGFYEGEGSGNTPIDALHALCENVGQRYPISRHSSPTPRLESQILLSSAVINKRGGEA
jgi:hypothetical protein